MPGKAHQGRKNTESLSLDYSELIDILNSGGILNYDNIKAWYLHQKNIMKQQAKNISGLTYNTILTLSESHGLPIYEVFPNNYKLLTKEDLKNWENQSAEYYRQINKKIDKYRLV